MEQVQIDKSRYEELLKIEKAYNKIKSNNSAAGKASVAKLTPEQRSELARKAGIAAAKKRWGENSVKKKD